jgi:hypothetical protein
MRPSPLGDDIRPNALSQLRAKVRLIRPDDVSEVLDVEVNEFQFVLTACPNDLAPQTTRKASLEIDSAALAGEVRNDELRESNLG